jgi:hypothetical protein
MRKEVGLSFNIPTDLLLVLMKNRFSFAISCTESLKLDKTLGKE